MTFFQLDCFLMIQHHMSFSKAAEELCISQSSLSKHVRAMEDEIGAQLFERTTKRTYLTSAGREFSRYAQSLVSEYGRMLTALKDYSPQRRQHLALASIPAMSVYGMTDILSEFLVKNPQYQIDIVEEDTAYVVSSLINHRADVAFAMAESFRGKPCRIFPLFKDEVVLLVGRAHPFAGQDTVRLAEANNEFFLFLGENTGMYDFCLEACRAAGFEPKISNKRQTNMQVETIGELVSKGAGVSMLLRSWAMSLLNPGLRIVSLTEAFAMTLALVVREEPLPSAARAFIEFALLSQAEQET